MHKLPPAIKSYHSCKKYHPSLDAESSPYSATIKLPKFA